MKVSYNEFSNIEKEEIFENELELLSKFKYIKYKRLVILTIFLLESRNIITEVKISIYKSNSLYYISYNDNYLKFNTIKDFCNWMIIRFTNRCNKCNNN